MRILDVSPRIVFPPYRGSSVRTHNILRRLSAQHEIRQFSYARPAQCPASRSEQAVWIRG